MEVEVEIAPIESKWTKKAYFFLFLMKKSELWNI